MAKRILVDGAEPIIVETGSTIRDVLEQAGRDPVSVVIDGEIISRSDYDRPVPPHGMITNASPIKKGGATFRERLLDKEAELIATRFLRQFPGTKRSLEVGENTLLFRAFPLPDDYRPDWIDLLLVTYGYPELPPAGVYVPAKSPNRGQISEHLGGHLFNSVPSILVDRVEELEKEGWSWVCYHFANWSWRLNPKNLLAGDCLFKYVENVFAALSGGHR